MILPVDLRSGPFIPRGTQYPWTDRNTFGSSFSYTQIVNSQLQLALLADVIFQQGFLGLPFHRVYFSDNSVHMENLPTTRWKIPVSHSFLSVRFIACMFNRQPNILPLIRCIPLPISFIPATSTCPVLPAIFSAPACGWQLPGEFWAGRN